MPYTTIQRTTILQKIIDKITKEFFYCREESDLNDMMRRILNLQMIMQS